MRGIKIFGFDHVKCEGFIGYRVMSLHRQLVLKKARDRDTFGTHQHIRKS